MSAPRTILITGATGKQGGAVITNLLTSSTKRTQPLKMIALTRDVQSRGAQKLAAKPNISVIEGDLSYPNAIFARTGPIWGVFHVQINSDVEEEQGKPFIDAAVAHGVEFYVYASGDRGGPERSSHDPTWVKNFAAKYNIEKHLQGHAQSSSRLSYTILRPVTFFDNLTNDVHGKGFARMWEQMGPKRLQMVATQDIGWFAANAFLNPDKNHNASLTIVGDELSHAEADAIYQEIMGSPMQLAPCLIGSAVKYFKQDTVGDMFRWFEEVGYGGNVEECRRVHPDVQDYRTWLIESILKEDNREMREANH